MLFRGDPTLLDERPWWRDWLRRQLLRWVYRHVDVAIAVGSNNRDYFAWCGLPPDRIAFAPHSVDTARFAADGASHDRRAAQWRLDMRITPDAIVVLFAGKLQAKKNPGLLLDAFGALHAQAHLVFVGNGELEAKLKTEAEKREECPFSAVPKPDRDARGLPPRRCIRAAVVRSRRNLGACAQRSDGERPCRDRDSKVGGARDLIEHNVTGWTFESGDREALIRILGEALTLGQPSVRQMGMKAQAASLRWSTDASTRAIAETVLSARTRS